MNNELITQPSWWKRNWKWVVPLGGCLGMLLLFATLIGSLVYGVFSVLEKATPYEYALEKINQDEQMIAVLGTPIEKDGMIQGSVNYLNGDGKANLKIPISGPKGNGTLFVIASSIGDEWTYHEIRVEIKDNEDIDLLDRELNDF